MKKKQLLFALIIGLLILPDLGFSQIRYGRALAPKEKKEPINLDYSDPKRYEIAEITVDGAEFLDTNALISLSGLKVGDRILIPGDDISTAIKKLWGQGIIGEIGIVITDIQDDKVWLEIQLKERPRLSRFRIEGVNKTQQSELGDKIKLMRGRILTESVEKNTEMVIKNYFKEKGYLNTEVRMEKSVDSAVSNSVRMVIHVDKNKKVRINRVNFEGNEAFDAMRLKGKLKETKERPRFTLFKDWFNRLIRITPSSLSYSSMNKEEADWTDIKMYFHEHVKLNFFSSSKYQYDEFQDDKRKLIDFYNSKGYRDAEVISDTMYYVAPNRINVDIKVDEGIKYYFKEILWSGNFIYEDSILSRVLGIKAGDVYDMETVNKRLNFNPQGADVSAIYMDDGYLFFNVEPVEVAIDSNLITTEMRIFEGPQATINKIIIKGNDRTNDHVVMREIRTLPGQKFSRSDLIRTQRELSQLGYFDPEQIDMNPIPNMAKETVDIEYGLVERPSDQIELSGGWGGFFGFVGTVGVVFNNFSVKNIPNLKNWRPLPVGDGQQLALRVQANGRRFQNYSFTFSEPWLGGKKPNNFTVNLTRSVQRNIEFGTDIQRGSFTATGATIGLGRRVTWPDDFFVVRNSVGFMQYNVDRFGIIPGFSDGVANSITFNTTIARNSIDQQMYPRRGSNVSLEISATPPYSLLGLERPDSGPEQYRWLEFHKWMFDASHYIQIYGDLVLSARAHGGFIGRYNSNAPITPIDRFLLGGDGMMINNFMIGTEMIGLRGYDNNSIGTIRQDGGSGQQGGGFLGGGTGNIPVEPGIIFNKFVAELRYPVSLNPQATIFVLGFAEAGNNWANRFDYNPFDIKRSAGVGARIFMPAFGLLGIDWGYGFDNMPGQTTPSGSQFHFMIGQQIR
ncbi:MAG: BamA/TamA family outer membrane protein [Cyclobacteriaceae bacterium]|nr:BamA/TamA family outer membrane protein [Cyclobacteriaceae bacterium]MCH8515644.1 BamA/TamA family outer membrane protein [Cyclobacteriaceae bacterium]